MIDSPDNAPDDSSGEVPANSSGDAAADAATPQREAQVPASPPPVAPPAPAPEPSRLGWPSAPPPFTRTPASHTSDEPVEAVEQDPPPTASTPVDTADPVLDQGPEPAPASRPADLDASVTHDPQPDDPTDNLLIPIGGENPTQDAPDQEMPDRDASAHEAASSPAPRALLVPVLAALALVLAGLTAFLGWSAVRTAGPAPVDASRSQALAAAREAARLVFSYDYRRLDKDFAAGKAVTTGEFAKEYGRTTAKLVNDVAPRYKARVSADVSEASVVRATGDKVVCLVFVNQTSLSSLTPKPKITQSRLEMVLERSGDRWLVSSIDAL